MPINLIGFARTSAGLIEFTLIALVVICAALVLLKAFVFSKIEEEVDKKEITRFVNIIAGVLATFIIGNFVLGMLSLSTSNRIPRQDVDRSGIYQQMESNQSGKK
jgi:hypothetical protein